MDLIVHKCECNSIELLTEDEYKLIEYGREESLRYMQIPEPRA